MYKEDDPWNGKSFLPLFEDENGRNFIRYFFFRIKLAIFMGAAIGIALHYIWPPSP